VAHGQDYFIYTKSKAISIGDFWKKKYKKLFSMLVILQLLLLGNLLLFT